MVVLLESLMMGSMLVPPHVNRASGRRTVDGMARDKDHAQRITTAGPAHTDEVDHRQRRYLISMSIRTVCFVLAAVTAPHWSMWLFLVASLVLPYVAVVAANVGTNTDPDPLPEVGSDRWELPPSPMEGPTQ
jgi:hypothetical protein